MADHAQPHTITEDIIMAELTPVLLPKLGESIMNATVVQWFKKVGDSVQVDEPLLEVSTDKVNSEIPSPVAGVLHEILAQPDQEIEVGQPLAVISSGSFETTTSSKPQSSSSTAPPSPSPGMTAEGMGDFFSPALLKMAREKGVGFDELSRIPATGAGGRLSKKDLESYLDKKGTPKVNPPALPTTSAEKAEIERVKMTGMRKAIAENMVRSFYEAPHASLIAEVDVTPVMHYIQKEKEAFFEQHGVKLTITSFVARALTRALQEFPLINSSLDQDTILIKHYVNLGFAVSVQQGIFVPVIKNCQQLALHDIAKAIHSLSHKARTNTLAPDDTTEGSITLTNFGMSGVSIGIPIIRYPEVAIVGIGAVQKKVVALENDTIGVRSMMFASLTFDHRVLDGMYGCGFLAAFKKHLESDITLTA